MLFLKLETTRLYHGLLRFLMKDNQDSFVLYPFGENIAGNVD
jgi:hypothetical protein